MAELQVGSPAPDFTLSTDSGETLALSSLRGKRVILYFYPKADTPGCTTEACDFRDRAGSSGAVVVGISPDKVPALAKFKEKYGLTFTLVSDPDHAVAEAYGAWVEKKNYGKTYFGIGRSTFVIGADGKLEKIYRNVKAKGHAEAVLAAL
jgi:peroxiredoxin Q/BCP